MLVVDLSGIFIHFKTSKALLVVDESVPLGGGQSCRGVHRDHRGSNTGRTRRRGSDQRFYFIYADSNPEKKKKKKKKNI